MGKILDALACWYVRRRIRGEPLRRTAPRFGDRIIAALQAEIDSRTDELARLDAELRAHEAAAAEGRRRALALERFENSEPDGLRLQ